MFEAYTKIRVNQLFGIIIGKLRSLKKIVH